jgi:hypothetical protein
MHKSHSYVNHIIACPNILVSAIIKLIRVKINIVCVEIKVCVYKLQSTCENHTLRIEITLVYVQIILVSAIITLIRVKIALVCVEIPLYLWKSHSACKNYTCV